MRITLRNAFSLLYVFITLALFLLVNFDGATGFQPMVVPHIEGHVVVIHFVITIICFVGFMIERMATSHKIWKDPIIILLLIKCCLDIIPLVRNGVFGKYFWYYAITVASFLTYFIVSNIRLSNKSENILKKVFAAFGILMSLQVFYTYVYSDYSWTDIQYKSAMVIPYGGTNIIASLLVPVIVLTYLTFSSWKKWILITVMTAAVILTKSRGGVLLELMIGSLLVYHEMGKRKNKLVSRLFLIVTVFIFLISLLQNNTAQTFLSGYSSVSINSGVNALLSGRISVWKEALEEFSNNNHIFFGNGMQPAPRYASGAHNIIIDVFLKCGVLGALNYFIMLGKYIKKQRKSHNCWFIMSIVIFINSLFEVCYFSYSCDVMLWIICGIATAKRYSYERSLVRKV